MGNKQKNVNAKYRDPSLSDGHVQGQSHLS